MALSLEEKLKSLYLKHFSKCDEIPADVENRAFRELGETDDTKRDALKKLRDHINQNSADELGKEVAELFHTRDDDYLLRFLRAKKFDIDRSYSVMLEFVKFRIKYPEISKTLSVEDVKNCLRNGYPGLLPFRDNHGRAVLVFEYEDWKPKAFPFDTIICAYIYLLEHLLINEETQINGFIIVQNLGNSTMVQAMAVKLSEIRKLISILQDAFPGRFKGIHFIYEPWYFRWFYAFIKPFLKEKLSKRVHIHGENLTDYRKLFDVDFIPETYGGKGPAYRPDIMVSSLAESSVKSSQGFKKFVKKAFSFF